MWIEKDAAQDPYRRGGQTISNPNNSVGAGGGGGAPLGAQSNQTIGNPSTVGPTNTKAPEQKFATVQDYLGANKAQGNQLGEKFKSGLQTKAQDFKNTIDYDAGNVINNAAANTVSFDSDLVNTARNNPTAVANNQTIQPTKDAPGPWGSTVKVPTGPAKSYKLDDFLKQWNASYGGPANFESTADYAAASKAAQDAQTTASQVGDAAGRKQILQDDFGVYGQGNKSLDQTLLQNSNQFAGIQGLGSQFAALPNYLKTKAGEVNAATQKAAETTEATKKNTRDLFDNALTGFQTDLTNRVSADQQQALTAISKIKEDLASGDLSKISDDLAKSNLTAAQKADIKSYLASLNQTYGARPDLTNYYTYNPNTDVTASRVATKEDYDRAAALQKLTGVDYSGVLNPADVSQANTWNNVSTGLQGASLQNYLKGSLGQQDKELMAKNNISDISTKLNLPDLLKNTSDVNLGKKLADTIIQVAKRTGTKPDVGSGGFVGSKNTLGQLISSVRTALTKAANASGGRLDNPQVAGLKAANDALLKYFVGNNVTKL